MSEQRVIGEAIHYHELQLIFRARKEELKLSNNALDDIAGLPEGLAGKLLSDPPRKNMGITTFGYVAMALGLKLIVVEDPEAAKKMRKMWVKNTKSQLMRPPRSMPRFFTSATAIHANGIRVKKVPSWRRRQIARKAARAMWRARRAKRREMSRNSSSEKQAQGPAERAPCHDGRRSGSAARQTSAICE